MAVAEIGPNDIIIHLVNPFKCMDCGTEFFHRSSFLQHLSEHMDKLKAQHPCYQIVCGVNLAAQQPNSITVTKDILQINENQIFELQDSSIDYTQLPPLKMLEQAGILRLPTPEKASSVPLVKFQNNTPTVNIALPSPRSLLPQRISQRNIQGQGTSSLNSTIGFLGPAPDDKQLSEANIDLNNMHDLQHSGTTSDELQAFVQQALLENEDLKDDLSASQTTTFSDNGQVLRKNDNSGQFTAIPSIGITKGSETWVSIESQPQHQIHEQQHQQALPGVKHVMVFKEMPEPLPLVDDRRVECKICLSRFASKNVLMRHQVVHSGEKPHSCFKCFKQFNDISSLSKHIKIHKRSHQCPVCLKMFLRRRQMELHLGQHKKKRFIQFGHKYHEVQIATSRNESGQIVHEFSLSVLLKKRSNEDNAHKENQVVTTSENVRLAEDLGTPVIATVSAESINASETLILPHQSEEQSTEGGDLQPTHTFGGLDCVTKPGHKQNESSGTSKVVYRCGHCKKYINTRPTLSRHLMLHTNERPFRCEQCTKQFRHKSDLVHHYKTHSKPVKCLTCGSAFSKELYLQNHLQRGCPFLESDNDKFFVLPNLRYQCNLCSRVLKSKANMVRHLRIHAFNLNNEESDSKKMSKNIKKGISGGEDDNENIMDIRSDNPDDYIKTLDDSVGYVCSLCGEEFRFKSYIVIHVRMHLGLRPFKCKECGKGFHGRHMLRKHQQNHTKPYKCPKCGKGFNRRYLMTHHFEKSHSEDAEERLRDVTYLQEEKLLQCDICGKTMKSFQKSLMQYHVRLHKDVRPHQCKVCDKTFISNIALKKHSMNHSKPYVCRVCNKGYSRRYLMLDHFEKICKHKVGEHEKVFASEEKMVGNITLSQDAEENQIIILKAEEEEEEKSVEKPNAKPYQAEIVTELDEVRGKEVYKCAPCNKAFTVRDSLSRHMKTFMKSTPCKYCKTVFEDKHLTLAHQRSCLGTDVSAKMKTSSKSGSTIRTVGEKQEKVLKAMKEMNSIMDNLTAKPVIPTNTETSGQSDQDHSDQDLEDVLSLLNSENIDSEPQLSTAMTVTKQTPDNIKAITKRTISALKEDKKSTPYKCPNCEKAFVTPRGLKIHASSHVRLYKCDKCGQDFTQVAKFRHHLKLHDDTTEGEEGMSSGDSANVCDSSLFEADKTKSKTVESSNNDTRLENSPKRRKLLLDNEGTPAIKELNISEDETSVDESNARLDIEHVSARLMQSGTRGRPFSCKMCRKRFTEESVLHQHMSHAHGMKC